MQEVRDEVEEIFRVSSKILVEFKIARVTLQRVTLQTARRLPGHDRRQNFEAVVEMTVLTGCLADYFLKLARILADPDSRTVELKLDKGQVSCVVLRFRWAGTVDGGWAILADGRPMPSILHRDLLRIDERLRRDKIASNFQGNLLELKKLKGHLYTSDILRYLDWRLGPLSTLRQFAPTN